LYEASGDIAKIALFECIFSTKPQDLTFAVFSNFFGLDEVIYFHNCFCTEYTFLWNFDIVIEFDFSFLQSCQDF